MTGSALALLGLIIAGYVLFKIIGFMALGMGYWYLAREFSWPLPF